jgi:hypothetical protein
LSREGRQTHWRNITDCDHTIRNTKDKSARMLVEQATHTLILLTHAPTHVPGRRCLAECDRQPPHDPPCSLRSLSISSWFLSSPGEHPPPFRLIPPLPLSQPDVPRASRSINSRAHGVSQAGKDGEERESCGDKCQQERGEAHMVFVRGHVGARMYACRRGRVCYAHTRGWCRVKQPTNNTSAQTMIM